MADIFLSYAREDAEAAARLAALLTGLGWSVFWDRSIAAGTDWDVVVERELRASKCVVTLWSAVSAKSRWVRTEANFGLKAGTLVPASLDGTEPPLAFQLVEAAQLQGWNGDGTHPEFLVLTAGIARYVPLTPPGPAPDGTRAATPEGVGETRAVRRAPGSRRLARLVLACGGVLLLILAIWGVYAIGFRDRPEPDGGAVATTGLQPKTPDGTADAPSVNPGPPTANTVPLVIETTGHDTVKPPKPAGSPPGGNRSTPPKTSVTGTANNGGIPRTEAADRGEIESVVFRFRDAYNDRNLHALRSVFKSASEKVFQNRSCPKVTLAFVGPLTIDVSPSGSEAEVTVDSTYTCTKTTAQRGGKVPTVTDIFQMTRENGEWTISRRMAPIQ